MTNHPYSSLDEHHMDGMRHDSVDYGDPNEPRRKRQKFHRSRTACFPVSHLLHFDAKEYQSDVSVVPDKEGKMWWTTSRIMSELYRVGSCLFLARD